MGRLLEFFENDAGWLSMNRLILFGSFCITSFVMAHLTGAGKMSEGYLTIYLGAFVASYAVSRTGDYKTIKAGAPNEILADTVDQN